MTSEAEVEKDNQLSEQEVVAKAKEFLEGVIERMDLGGHVDVKDVDERWVLEIETENAERIIGRRGQVIDALQHLTAKAVSKYRGRQRGKPIVLDAGGYREKHIERLQGLADRTREQVLEAGEAVHLNPMSAYDRRIVHVRVSELGGVRTESEGQGEDRHIVVFPGE